MTNAVLLGAGQGRRLAPLTDHRPKCLVKVAGRTILEWQVQALAAAGVRDVTVVTGFEGASVEAALRVMALPVTVRCRHNPFYGVGDNIVSVWVARDLLGEDTVLINGDTLFDPRILSRVMNEAKAPVTVTIDRKKTYDADDMKVRLAGDRLARIGKALDGAIDGESIGLLRFREGGGARFAQALDETLREPEALGLWYLSVVDALAESGVVGIVPIEGLPWAEVDFPHDIPIAADRLAGFDWGGAGPGDAPDGCIAAGSGPLR